MIQVMKMGDLVRQELVTMGLLVYSFAIIHFLGNCIYKYSQPEILFYDLSLL